MSRTLPYSNCDEDDDIPFSIGSSRFSNTFPKQQEMRTLRDGILRWNYRYTAYAKKLCFANESSKLSSTKNFATKKGLTH